MVALLDLAVFVWLLWGGSSCVCMVVLLDLAVFVWLFCWIQLC